MREGTYGLVVLSATTGWFYWTLISLAGLVLLAHTVTRRLRTLRIRTLAITLVLAVAAMFFEAYIAIGEIGVDHPPHGTIAPSPA